MDQTYGELLVWFSALEEFDIKIVQANGGWEAHSIEHPRSRWFWRTFATEEEATVAAITLAEGKRDSRDKNWAKVPDAPLKTTWHEMAFRRAVRWAAEHGFDRVAWTTGAQQTERYGLSRQVEAIVATKRGDEVSLKAVMHANDHRDIGTYRLDQLDEVVGKDLAQKIAAQKEWLP